MRIATLLATAAALTASAALAQTTPQTTPPATATPQTGTSPDSTMPSTDAPAGTPTPPAPGDTTTPDTGSAPAAAVIPTTATTLVQPAVGVDVLDAAGAKAGTIKALDNQFVTITTAKGDVRLAKTSIGPGPNGAVIGGTAADLEAAAARATTPAAPARTSRRAPRRR